MFAALTAIFAKIGVSGVNSNLATAIRTTVIVLLVWAIAACTSDLGSLTTISRRTWIFLGLSGVATALSWLCYFRALQLGEASQIAPVDKLSVVLTIALAAIFLKETLTWHQWVGGSLILAGAIVIALQR